MAYMDGNEQSPSASLPKDHWIHKALAKETTRIAKKGAKGATGEKPVKDANPEGNNPIGETALSTSLNNKGSM